tara:strand:+ start:213 stop:488 length:276 start_codon:yes stop_codon:yes gene_type:complete
MRKFEKLGHEIGKLVQEKNAAYGDSFGQSEEILEILYPNGVQPRQYKDLLAVTRVLDKLFRIATDKDALGESPWRDIAGYALLSIDSDETE